LPLITVIEYAGADVGAGVGLGVGNGAGLDVGAKAGAGLGVGAPLSGERFQNALLVRSAHIRIFERA
jgi:hypothetical protein